MREYELITVVQPGLDNDGVKALVEQVSTLIANAGGQVTEVGQLAGNSGQVVPTETWVRRRLAYPLERHREGYYTIYRVQAPATTLPSVERQLKLNENVLRYLFVRTDE